MISLANTRSARQQRSFAGELKFTGYNPALDIHAAKKQGTIATSARGHSFDC